jgi:hypothetical protein
VAAIQTKGEVVEQATSEEGADGAQAFRHVAVSGGAVLGAALLVLSVMGTHDLRGANTAMLTSSTDFAITTTISSSANGSVPAVLSPGVERYLVYNVSNPMPVPITVTALRIASVSSPSGCPATNLDVSNAGFGGLLDVPANGSNHVEAPISLIDTAVNQDACKNVTFNFTESGTATYDEAATGGVPPLDTLTRLAGADRTLTAIAVSQNGFENGVAGAVVITRSDLYPDALSGTPLAVHENAPMLFTAPTTLNPGTEAELQRVLPAGRTVYVLGGSAAIAPATTARLSQDGYRVVRLAGATRFDTAVAIARYLGTPNDILLATGMDQGDALAAGAAAAKLGGVVVLTDDGVMPAVTTAYLASENGVAQFALGGPAAAAAPSATPLVGADRYATSVLVAQRFFPTPTVVGFANGFAFPDAMSGGTAMGEKHGPLILVAPDVLPQSVGGYLRSVSTTVTTAFVYGGTAVIPDSELQQIGQALHGR